MDIAIKEIEEILLGNHYRHYHYYTIVNNILKALEEIYDAKRVYATEAPFAVVDKNNVRHVFSKSQAMEIYKTYINSNK